MDDRVNLSISRKARNVLIGKVIILLILGCLAGYYAEMSSRVDYAKGKALTRQEYLKDYDNYRQKLTRHTPSPVGLMIFVACLALFVVFGLYELSGRAVGAVVGVAAKLIDGQPSGVAGEHEGR